MAGLLACGSKRVVAFPGFAQWQLTKRSPHTVAGAAVDLGPVWVTHPTFPFHPPMLEHVSGGTMPVYLA